MATKFLHLPDHHWTRRGRGGQGRGRARGNVLK